MLRSTTLQNIRLWRQTTRHRKMAQGPVLWFSSQNPTLLACPQCKFRRQTSCAGRWRKGQRVGSSCVLLHCDTLKKMKFNSIKHIHQPLADNLCLRSGSTMPSLRLTILVANSQIQHCNRRVPMWCHNLRLLEDNPCCELCNTMPFFLRTSLPAS